MLFCSPAPVEPPASTLATRTIGSLSTRALSPLSALPAYPNHLTPHHQHIPAPTSCRGLPATSKATPNIKSPDPNLGGDLNHRPLSSENQEGNRNKGRKHPHNKVKLRNDPKCTCLDTSIRTQPIIVRAIYHHQSAVFLLQQALKSPTELKDKKMTLNPTLWR